MHDLHAAMATVTVIIPTYNRKTLLLEALRSVQAQTYTDYEIIVVDDGSTDDTGAAVASQAASIRYFWKPNGGEASARNYGIQCAKTDYVAFLDSDDSWTPDFLATTLSYLCRHPDIELVATGCSVVPGNVRRLRVAESLLHGDLFARLFMQNFITASAVVVQRRCLEAVGLFDESLDQATDYDMWLRIAKRYPIAFINQPLCLWRRHPGNISGRELSHRQRVLDVVMRHHDPSRLSRWAYTLRRSRLFGSMGRAYGRSGDIERAATCMIQALRLAPWRVRAWRDFFIIAPVRLLQLDRATPDASHERRHPHSARRIKNRKRLGWIARQLRHRFALGAWILCYHRVGTPPCDPNSLSVSLEHFAQQMELLHRLAHPIRLSQLVEGLRRGTIPRGAVVVTFDDGYASVLHQALPIVKQYEIPVTIFMTSGFLGSKRETWNDELEQILLQPNILPERLSLNLEGVSLEWRAENAVYTEQDAALYRIWTLDSGTTPTLRHRLFRLLHSRLLPLPEARRLRVIDELIRWSGATLNLRSTHRFLLSDELSILADDDLVDIGAHSVSHPVLPNLPMHEQEREIAQSRTALEQTIGRPIRSFAYPYGARSCDTIELVRRQGFDSACITFDDVVFPGTDQFQLPRIFPRNATGEELARRIGLSSRSVGK